jgi:catechol 2,3-dioxygenase-like lactoylglutathione lyase family enzyme
LNSWPGAEPLVDDPLGVRRGSHTTIAVADVDEASAFWCRVMGARLVSEGDSDGLGARTSLVEVGAAGRGTLVEFAEPIADGPVARDRTACRVDMVHAYTFLVDDLERVRRHLDRERFGLEVDGPHLIVTDPVTTAGARYGFADRDP